MKRVFIVLGLMFVLSCSMYAQNNVSEEKTILYLIPFYSTNYNPQVVSAIRDCDEIRNVSAFQLMGFWAGAQIALDEFNANNVHLNVIVKDVTDNETRLRSILDNQALMEKVDLIIGPFFSRQFAIAAQYAKKYKIPIVNPFTTRTDILNNNEFVYKPTPSLETRASTVSFLSDVYPQSQILIYADTLKSQKEYQIYASYFRKNSIKFKVVPLQKDIIPYLKADCKNIVWVLTSESAKMLMMSRDLIFKSQLENLLLVVPEDWLNVTTYDIEYYSKLNIHFFSDYYVDNDNEKTQVFIHNYREKFNTLPTIASFSFQGYDVTRYFINALFHDMDLDMVKTETIGYHFGFDKVPSGGYENINTQFLEVKDNVIKPAEY